MVVIIKKEKGRPIYNVLNVSNNEKTKAKKLDEMLSRIIPTLEESWSKRIIKKKGHKKIDINVAYKIGEKLSKIVENKKLVAPNERKWVWKAIRELYLKSYAFTKRDETRDDLEYFYKTSHFPLKFIINFSWDAWKRLLDSPSIRHDKRFEEWLQGKAKKASSFNRVFIRNFTKILYSLIKHKDTTVLTDQELFKIYESAWTASILLDRKRSEGRKHG